MDVNLGLLVHLINFVLFTTAAVVALREFHVSEYMPVWLMLSGFLVLTAISPLLGLFEHLSVPGRSMVEWSDMLATLRGGLLVTGVSLLGRITAERRRSQLQLHEQLDELQRFQRLAVGRELRMKELVAENAALHEQLARAGERRAS